MEVDKEKNMILVMTGNSGPIHSFISHVGIGSLRNVIDVFMKSKDQKAMGMTLLDNPTHFNTIDIKRSTNDGERFPLYT